MEGCSVAQRSKNAFDPTNPAGLYFMNCGHDYGQSVLQTVVEMVSGVHMREDGGNVVVWFRNRMVVCFV